MQLDNSIQLLLAKIQRDHPWTAHDLEMSVYKSELTNDESNLYMAYQIWKIREDFDNGKNQNRKAFLEITQEIDRGHFKWIKSWIKDFHLVADVIEHFNLVQEFYVSRNWYSGEYDRLKNYHDDVLNAYLNIKKSDKTKEDHIQAFEKY